MTKKQERYGNIKISGFHTYCYVLIFSYLEDTFEMLSTGIHAPVVNTITMIGVIMIGVTMIGVIVIGAVKFQDETYKGG